MKKLLKVLAVAIFALTPFIVGSSASAAATCDVGFTGPDAQNQCTSVTEYTCSVTSTNVVDISNGNTQVVTSGQVVVSGNGQGGNATSGTVSNTNGSTFSVVITNYPDSERQDTCVATVVVPATVTSVVQPTQPETGGGGAVALPETSGDFTPILIIVASSMVVIAALGVGGVALYRYFKSL